MKYLTLYIAMAVLLTGCKAASINPTQQVKTPTLTLNLFCTGSGEPTVLLLPGLSGKSSNWGGVIAPISLNNKVCAFDFIPNDRVFTGSDVAQTIPNILKQESITDGVILVAHSFGGYIARFFYQSESDKVVGVVLVESSHPDMMTAYQPLISTST